jgi:2-methylcitrate dehydratase PrpD
LLLIHRLLLRKWDFPVPTAKQIRRSKRSLQVHLADGTEQSEHIRHGRGTPGRPMSDAELDSKVRELAAYGAPFVDADGLIAAVRGIEGEADPTRLMRLTVPG